MSALILITSDLEPDEMRAWIYSCCGAMGFSIIVFEPLILISHWLYEIKYADVVEDEDVIVDKSVSISGMMVSFWCYRRRVALAAAHSRRQRRRGRRVYPGAARG